MRRPGEPVKLSLRDFPEVGDGVVDVVDLLACYRGPVSEHLGAGNAALRIPDIF
jgi:hypothetical protein